MLFKVFAFSFVCLFFSRELGALFKGVNVVFYQILEILDTGDSKEYTIWREVYFCSAINSGDLATFPSTHLHLQPHLDADVTLSPAMSLGLTALPLLLAISY